MALTFGENRIIQLSYLFLCSNSLSCSPKPVGGDIASYLLAVCCQIQQRSGRQGSVGERNVVVTAVI